MDVSAGKLGKRKASGEDEQGPSKKLIMVGLVVLLLSGRRLIFLSRYRTKN